MHPQFFFNDGEKKEQCLFKGLNVQKLDVSPSLEKTRCARSTKLTNEVLELSIKRWYISPVRPVLDDLSVITLFQEVQLTFGWNMKHANGLDVVRYNSQTFSRVYLIIENIRTKQLTAG